MDLRRLPCGIRPRVSSSSFPNCDVRVADIVVVIDACKGVE